MNYSFVIARDKSAIIAIDGQIPWMGKPEYRNDLKNFKNLTTGSIVIMGSKTYETWPYHPRTLWGTNNNPPPNASAPLWPTSTGTRNWPGRAGARSGGRGGSGIVIIKYPIVFGNVTTTGTPITTVTDNGFLVYQFVDSGSIKFDYTP